MARQFTVISQDRVGQQYTVVSGEEKLRDLLNVTSTILQDADNTWAEIWNELMGVVTDGAVILPEAEKGFKPKCGWPEFLERIWLLKHQLDSAKRHSQGASLKNSEKRSARAPEADNCLLTDDQ
ncbi:MAG: hypothetical protein LLG06_09355 [Desulfobacteraceae bacterium]|nr:hypothetical protein [Desulfobacteraceae bacterium]